MDPFRLCMISGSFEYESEASLTLYQDYIAKHRPKIETTLIVYQSEDDHQSLEPIENTDVLLVFTRRVNTAGAELNRFMKYCQDGRPIVGVRTASHAFQNWLAFDKEVQGGNYEGHYGGGPVAHITKESGAVAHPILSQVEPFDSQGSLYINTPIAEDTTLLLTGHTDEHEEPVAWTRMHNGGRVFYTSLGHQEDFKDNDFLKLLTNAVRWAAGRL